MTASISRGHLKLGNLLVKLRGKREKILKIQRLPSYWFETQSFGFLGLN
jgi:hypothetical protein